MKPGNRGIYSEVVLIPADERLQDESKWFCVLKKCARLL